MSVALASVESWEDHVEAWHALGREVDGAAWARAAIAASLKGRYGEDAVGRFAEEVGFNRASVYDFARTFESFPAKSDRSESLTFSHHLHAARLAADAEGAKAAVALAEREGWSTSALRAYLRPPALPGPAADKRETDNGACGPPTTDAQLMHIAHVIQKLEAIDDYDVELLVGVCTKKSLREMSKKIDAVAAWIAALQTAIKRKTT